MAELRRACSENEGLPQPLIVHLGTVEDGDRFLGDAWPEVQSIADADMDVRAALGVSRGRVGQLLGLASMAAGLRSVRAGHKQTRPVGDPWMMPGAFLAQRDQVLWSHEFRHAGDHPSTAALLAAVGAGVFETVEAAAREGIRWSGRLEPDAGAAPALEAAYRRYQALYPALRASFEAAGQG